jgi:hypothetical protein
MDSPHHQDSADERQVTKCGWIIGTHVPCLRNSRFIYWPERQLF